MESLFVPADKVLGQVHPLMQMVIDCREQFISKQCWTWDRQFLMNVRNYKFE